MAMAVKATDHQKASRNPWASASGVGVRAGNSALQDEGEYCGPERTADLLRQPDEDAGLGYLVVSHPGEASTAERDHRGPQSEAPHKEHAYKQDAVGVGADETERNRRNTRQDESG